MDVSQYLDVFIDESKEHLQNLNTRILELEQEPENMDTINEIFRAAHTLKGMAGTMGYKRMQNLTHKMEDVFSEVRNGAAKVNSSVVDALFLCLDALEEYVTNIQSTGDEGDNDNQALIKVFSDFLTAKNEEAPQQNQPEQKQAEQEQPGQTEPAKAKNDAAVGETWSTLTYNDSQVAIMQGAMAEGLKPVGITVTVADNCILKAARAFLVYKAVEEFGDIIVSVPSAQDIEDEKFDLEFSLVALTAEEPDKLINAAANVSEIAKVTGGIVSPVLAKEPETADVEEIQNEEKKPESAKNEVAVNSGETKNETAAPATGTGKTVEKKKPVVNRTVRVDIEKLDDLMNLVSELIIAKNSLVSAATTKNTATENVHQQIEYLESVTTNLHESVMKVRMVPIESVVNKFPRMIRDLQKKLDKKMELYMSGEETELDRTVVDEIGDPLMHLLRNSADHGIEKDVELRRKRGKPDVGVIKLDAYQDGNNVVIEVSDDGGGIDVEAVKNKALERGAITEEQASVMAENDIINLLFLPSFSTAKTVSDISGRGVGLDVVKSKIESLSGEVSVKSVLGEGSKWTIRLPLTLAIIQSLMVKLGDEKYAIPLGNIQTIESIPPADIKTISQKEVINLRGSIIPIIRLADVLGCTSSRSENEDYIIVIVRKGELAAGLVIDELMGQQEIVIKSLGKYINRSRVISGATILGDGEVALIIDPNALI